MCTELCSGSSSVGESILAGGIISRCNGPAVETLNSLRVYKEVTYRRGEETTPAATAGTDGEIQDEINHMHIFVIQQDW